MIIYGVCYFIINVNDNLNDFVLLDNKEKEEDEMFFDEEEMLLKKKFKSGK